MRHAIAYTLYHDGRGVGMANMLPALRRRLTSVTVKHCDHVEPTLLRRLGAYSHALDPGYATGDFYEAESRGIVGASAVTVASASQA